MRKLLTQNENQLHIRNADLIENLKAAFREQRDVIIGLLDAPLLDMATMACLIGQATGGSSSLEALSELQGHIMATVELIKTIKRQIDGGIDR